MTWVTLPDGSVRWGLHGAAGLLLHSGGHVLLARRAWWTDHGGTWAYPGGARDAGERPEDAAVREFCEEVDGDLTGLRWGGLHVQEHAGGWSYTTVLAQMPEQRAMRPGEESTAVRWVPLVQVEHMRLLPDFGRSWPELRKLIEEGT